MLYLGEEDLLLSDSVSLGGTFEYTTDSEKLFVGIDRQFLEECSSKKIMVYIYLGRFRSWADNIITLTIEHLVRYFGYIPNNDKGKINSQFREVLQEYIDSGFIETDVNITGAGKVGSADYVKPIGAKEIFSIKIVNIDMFKIVVDPDNYSGSGFVQLNFKELDTILANDKKSCTKPDLIMCYLAIKQYINFGTEGQKIAFPTIDTIGNVIDRHSKSVSSLIDELVDMKLLFRKNCGAYIKKRYGTITTRNFPIVYALEEEYLCQSDTVLKDYFKYDELIPFIEPPHKGKKSKESSIDNDCKESVEAEMIDFTQGLEESASKCREDNLIPEEKIEFYKHSSEQNIDKTVSGELDDDLFEEDYCEKYEPTYDKNPFVIVADKDDIFESNVSQDDVMKLSQYDQELYELDIMTDEEVLNKLNKAV